MKLIKFTLFIILSITFTACKGSIYDSILKDVNTGTYHLQGTKIQKELCFANFCEDGEVISADTTEIEFDIGLEYLEGTTDSLRFRYLPGADYGMRRATRLGAAFAKLNGGKLTFDIEDLGGAYFGTGFLGAGKISLNTTYYYRTLEIDYMLTGEKIDDEVLR